MPASEWARRKAGGMFWRDDESIAAALDEARAKGEKAAVTTAADVFASDVAQAYERGFAAGAERERWECHEALESPHPWERSWAVYDRLRSAIRCRGPMRGPEVVHRCPPEGSGLMPCCGRTPFEVPSSDRMTADAQLVTCLRGPKEAKPTKRKRCPICKGYDCECWDGSRGCKPGEEIEE